MHLSVDLLAYLGSALGVAMVVPQILRIVRNPGMGGVSPWTWAIAAISCTSWMYYGVRAHSLPQIPGNVFLVSGAVAIVLLVPAAWSRTRRAVLLGAVTALFLAIGSRLEPEQVGFLAFAIGLFGMWPQVYETVWLRRGMGPSALSLTTQVLKVVSQSLWLSFAILATDIPVLVAAIVTLTTNLVVTVVEYSRRRFAALSVGAPAFERELAAAEA
ncbi:MAG: PQ-loop domain-containing transporter [Candidatus Nanopelagicales bacterium]|jgi:uncharacterized protein with PQ loop repeat